MNFIWNLQSHQCAMAEILEHISLLPLADWCLKMFQLITVKKDMVPSLSDSSHNANPSGKKS